MKYEIERAVVTLSVRELCARALTAGDLDLRPGMGKRFSRERAELGSTVHRKLQAESGSSYTPEVPMTHTELFHGLAFEVSGRADGILSGDPVTVDEIKTVSPRGFDLPPDPLHEAQVRCYAYFWAVQRGLEAINTRLTYYRTEDGELRHITETHTREDLEVFYHDLLSRVEYRARILCERVTERLPSVASGHFPHASLREGQEELLMECYRDIRAGKRLFVQAPTGIGKTISTLYPAVRALGEGSIDKVFYLTAKSSTGREAFRAAGRIHAAGARLRTVVLSARETLCPNEEAKKDPAGLSRHCNPYDCPRARGFYDRAPHAVCSLLSKHDGYSRSVIEETAAAFSICPYEFQLELSELCDIIICDYNYAFDPRVYLRRYFSPEALGGEKYAFLVDEAHNLADRARGMYSASLTLSEVREVWRMLPPETELAGQLEKLNVMLDGLRRLCRDELQTDADGVEHGFYLNHAPLESVHERIRHLRPKLEGWLRGHREDPAEPAVYRLHGALGRFEGIADAFDRSFLTFVELEGGERTLRLVCLDPSHVLELCLSRAHAAILFSATLTPTEYFADILGGGRNALRLSIPSPFPRERLCVAAVTGIHTRFEERDSSYRKLAAVIAATASAQKGNYIVYFPSYEYLEKVSEAFEKKYPGVPLLCQRRGMTAQERDAFPEAFLPDGKLRIGFCVLGGSFSEGMDLPGRRLIGTVIVGVGLPGISNERNILRDHYEVTRERGFDYAYTYPGMNRVLQAAGRVIRREEDRGVVVLVDDRYSEPRYTQLFPEHWNSIQYAGNASELAEILGEFWKNEV